MTVFDKNAGKATTSPLKRLPREFENTKGRFVTPDAFEFPHNLSSAISTLSEAIGRHAKILKSFGGVTSNISQSLKGVVYEIAGAMAGPRF